MKTILFGVILAGAALALLGTPTAALTTAHPQARETVSYWHNGHWHPGRRPFFRRHPYRHTYRHPYLYRRPYRHPYLYHHPYRRPGINIHL